MLTKDHWHDKTFEFIHPHLQRAQASVDIATGYFTIQGYDLLQSAFSGKQVRILVGYDEASKEHLRDALIENLMAHLRRWDADNRRAAVVALVEMLQHGALLVKETPSSLNFIDSRIRNKDHAKIYIVDHIVVLVGSSNLSRSGLLSNTEGMNAVEEPERVDQWRNWYESYWNDPETISLTEQLLAALLQWLQLDPPFDIYLKTIQALVAEEPIDAPRQSYIMPTQYQWIVINRVLRQLEDWRGSIVVASTGLGKTIIATHVALMLREKKHKIRNVIVFAPKPMRAIWKEALDSAGVHYNLFVRNLLDQPSRSKGKTLSQVEDMLRTMDRVDEQYLIIIDESQYYSNRISARNTERRSFERLRNMIREKHPYVLLLTATPYSKGVEDIVNQLYLLPHTAPMSYLTQSGQMIMAGIGDHKGSAESWTVHEQEEFFDQFMSLPVSTVISTSQVARDFAISTPQGDYVDFPDGSARWIPRIHLQQVRTEVPFEQEITDALDKGFFRHKLERFQVRGFWMYSQNIVENQAKIAWASSPAALAEVLHKTIEDEYEVAFIRDQQQRDAILTPILDQLNQQTYRDDNKFLELNAQIKAYRARDEKIIIFVERHATAVYLEESLRVEQPDLQVVNTVRRLGRIYELKGGDEVEDLIKDFAPIANASRREPGRPKRQLDILIATDAHAVGLNLQDASVAISYDLAWTADPIIQRAGRVLRFWHGPREVSFLAFVPNLTIPSEYRAKASDVEHRLRTLRVRAKAAERFSELPIIPEEETVTYPSLSGLASVKIEDMGLLDSAQIEEFSGVSPFLRHYSNLHDHHERVDQLQDDLISALEYNDNHSRMYLLLRLRDEYRWAVYDIQARRFDDIKQDQLLDIIQCTPETIPASVGADEIEIEAQHCKNLWCIDQGITEPESVERICALYLVPSQKAEFEVMMHRKIETK